MRNHLRGDLSPRSLSASNCFGLYLGVGLAHLGMRGARSPTARTSAQRSVSYA